MIYSISILESAEEDLAWFRKYDKINYIKCFDLVRNIGLNPREGIGKPERLKYFDGEVFSRRVNQEDRVIYTIYEKEKAIDISSFRGHYE